jgi:hypothetical protein
MAEDQQNNPDENQQPPEPPSPPSSEPQDNPPTDSSETTPANQTSEHIQQQLPNIIVKYEKADDTQAVTANQISNRMFWATVVSSIISFGLLVATFFVWKATQGSVDVANAALKDEHVKDSLTRISDSIALRKQDSFYRQNGQTTHLVYQLDSTSLRQQLQNFSRSWKQYEIENKVYFVILGFGDTITPNGRYNSTIRVVNAGKTPAQLISLKRKNEIDSIYPLTNFVYNPIDTNSMGGDILPPGGTKEFISSSIPLPPDTYQKMSDHKLFLYIHGEIAYLDLVFHKRKVFKYCIYYDRHSNRWQFIPTTHNGTFPK